MTPRARRLLARIRAGRHAAPPTPRTVVPIRRVTRPARRPRPYQVLAIGLYRDQVEVLDALADQLRPHPNAPRNRSGAMQALIEAYRQMPEERRA